MEKENKIYELSKDITITLEKRIKNKELSILEAIFALEAVKITLTAMLHQEIKKDTDK